MASRVTLLVLANLLIPFAVLVFAVGFFPYKPFLPGIAKYEHVLGYSGPLEAPFDRVIFMVVDALRSDFVFSNTSGFSFTQNLIRRGHALPYTAHATSPTITMPRVKALTTGSIPSFLDVILNFAESDTTSTLAGQDTWLAQLRARGQTATEIIEDANIVRGKQQQEGTLVFYGDDTWLKLFPGFFERADGTSSFFVSDFTEVDNNVTRHIPTELLRSDWNALIMHFLGLDHIGHKAGPRSPNMIPKQQEMDGIVESIYNAITDPERPHLHRTLLVLCGDHGMNDGGNHGGSSEGETSPALTFVSPLLEMVADGGNECPTQHGEGDCCDYYRTVEQSDVVPTLAGLLGMPVPRNNLGIFIDEALGFWDDEAQLHLLLQNARQILNIVQATFPGEDFDGGQVRKSVKSTSDGAQLAFKWRKVDGLVRAKAQGSQLRKEHLKPLIIDFLQSAQEILSSTASNYNVTLLTLGISIAALGAISALFCVPLRWPPSATGCFFTLVAVAYSIMMFASSYVEEEQQFWNWITGGWIIFLYLSATRRLIPPTTTQKSQSFLNSPPTTTILLLVLHRISTHWTTTGVKHAGAPSISSSFLPVHPYLLWALVTFSYCYAAVSFSVCSNYGFADDSTRGSSPSSSLINLQRMAELLGGPGGLGHALLLASVGLTFKVNFTVAEAPELMVGMDWLRWMAELVVKRVGGPSLVMQARIVFGCLVIAGMWVGWVEWRMMQQQKVAGRGATRLAERLQSLLALFLFTQSRAQNIPLFLIFDLERRLFAQLFEHAFPPPAFSSSSTNNQISTYGSSSINPEISPTKPGESSASVAQTLSITLTALLLTHTSFFAPGGSNTISSIDLSNAYNGIAGYEVGLVGVLVFFGNWAGPVWWGWQAWIWLNGMGNEPRSVKRGNPGNDGAKDWIQEERSMLQNSTRSASDTSKVIQGNASSPKVDGSKKWDREGSPFVMHIAFLTLFTTVSLVAVQVACTVLRNHLFIWTVFSPKYLYAMAWSGGWHLLWSCAVGSLVWRSSHPRSG